MNPWLFVLLQTLIQNVQLKRDKKEGIKGKLMSVNFIGLAFREWPHLAHSHSAKPTFFQMRILV